VLASGERPAGNGNGTANGAVAERDLRAIPVQTR
jgi:hypothetical protein